MKIYPNLTIYDLNKIKATVGIQSCILKAKGYMPVGGKFRHIYKIPHIKAVSKPELTARLHHFSQMAIGAVLAELKTQTSGLAESEYRKRRKLYGFNEVAYEQREHWLIRLARDTANPLVLLLLVLMVISFATSDIRSAVVILMMVIVSVGLKFIQENQAYNCATALQSLVRTTATVIRHGMPHEIELSHIVPGDIVELTAGDIIPADIRVVESKELFVNQSVLTGESLPVDKHRDVSAQTADTPLMLANLCFMGTNVESGHAAAVVIHTGENTYFGSLAKSLIGTRETTSFDRGIEKFTYLMLAFMAVMVPLVFFINGFTKGNWVQAFFFAVAVTVGLTPEMLPAMVTVNLSKGAIAMSRKKVIVKHLSSIQNVGAMDILATDKTGTITQNNVALIDNVNIEGKTDPQVLHKAYLNSHFQTGFRNLLDTAILAHGKKGEVRDIAESFTKVDELPFDFKRKRLSIVAEYHGNQTLVCKGAPEEVAALCTHYELNGHTHDLTTHTKERIVELVHTYNRDGFRVIAIAMRTVVKAKKTYTYADEHDLTFVGLMTFFDPPKASAIQTIRDLKAKGVMVKILTGDSELVTQKIASEVGLPAGLPLLGHEMDAMNDEALARRAEKTTIFAKLSPDHKRRIINALQQHNHVVGFLGDGINDAPALRTADVGISVNTAVDIAKESADIVLLEMGLHVLLDGVIEGRRVFGNIVKYIKMGASSNFGNMFSMVGGSLLLPFLPMQPAQILINNLLYDFSQATIPTDSVDAEYMEKPRKWEIKDIEKFMLALGPVSSIFDYATFFIMLYVFNAWNNPLLFQTGWFVESLITQTLIVHVIRSRKIPFIQTWASKPLVISTVIIASTGILLTFSPLASFFHLVRLPSLYWPILLVILACYIGLTQLVKTWYIRRFGYN